MQIMTPLERFKVAAKLEIPDQVPVMPFATGHYIAWSVGLEEKEYWWDPVWRVIVKTFWSFRFCLTYGHIWR